MAEILTLRSFLKSCELQLLPGARNAAAFMTCS